MDSRVGGETGIIGGTGSWNGVTYDRKPARSRLWALGFGQGGHTGPEATSTALGDQPPSTPEPSQTTSSAARNNFLGVTSGGWLIFLGVVITAVAVIWLWRPLGSIISRLDQSEDG